MTEYTCVQKFWPEGSNIWAGHRQTCGKPAKFWVDAGGPAQSPVCGTHAAKARRQKRKVEPICTTSEAAVTTHRERQ